MKITQEVNRKVQLFAEQHCEGTEYSWRKGTMFGNFTAEPNDGFFYQENTGMIYTLQGSKEWLKQNILLTQSLPQLVEFQQI